MLYMSENLEAPIIIIGAGRSGTGLLERMLDAHPDIRMYGETRFLLSRLWRELWDDGPRIDFIRNRLGDKVLPGPEPTSFREGMARRGHLPEDIVESERRRMAQLAGVAVAAAAGVPGDNEGRWGYREIWNGSAVLQHDWLPYDLAFPRAYWLQIIRHPFDFARSCAGWNGDEFTPQYLEDRLRDWVAMIRWNRERRTTGRYSECRYEDLMARPSEVLAPVFERLGLSWDDACASQLEEHPHRSSSRPGFPICTLKSVGGLSETMSELGYEIPGLYRPLVQGPDGE